MQIDELNAFEREARVSKIRQIMEHQERDSDRMAEIAARDDERAQRRNELRPVLDRFFQDQDADALRQFTEAWSRKPGYDSFAGSAGQMFLNQLAKRVEPEELGAVLAEVISAPSDPPEAAAKIRHLVDFVESIKSGGHPAPARVPFVLSIFWSIQDPTSWPVMWSSAKDAVIDLGFVSERAGHAEQYLEFTEIVRASGDLELVVHALYWFQDNPFVGFAPELLDRCVLAKDLAALASDDGYPNSQLAEAAEANTAAMAKEMWLAARSMQEDVSRILGRPVITRAGDRMVNRTIHRWWVASIWELKGEPVSIRIAVTTDGVLLGLSADGGGKEWGSRAAVAAAAYRPTGLEFFQLGTEKETGRYLSTGDEPASGSFVLGRRLTGIDITNPTDVVEHALTIVTELRPVIDQLIAESTTGDGPIVPVADAEPVGDLARLVAEFKQQTGYPAAADQQHRSDRERFARQLTPEAIGEAEISLFRSIVNSRRYGGAGPQSSLNSTLTALDPTDQDRFRATISELLWGSGPVADRLDQVLSPENGYKGLGESVLMKLLAITHPERFLAVFPYTGNNGKARFADMIGLEPLPESLSRGEKQVRSNDALRQQLEPHLPGDTWAQSRFLYWLKERPGDESAETAKIDPVPELASELLLPESYVEEILHLLRTKGQIIFYGPPGTGKTHIAQQIAAAITDDPNRRTIVQFHPSTSYEDFFEGYRPAAGADGQLVYELVAGPLARIAEDAEESPSKTHVMVIDEINRANLPKVLGELLFLLEYRDQPIQTLYRPEDPFTLPPNLLIIGTMNTADRSVALIDAAMRRRFHFLPFFPHAEPHREVLGRWLDAHRRPMAWVAGLVEHVNERLVEHLGGPHLQIGHSHFLSETLDRSELERIWRYSIMPFIEDQLWGQQDLVDTYRFDRILADYRRVSGEVADSSGPEAADTKRREDRDDTEQEGPAG